MQDPYEILGLKPGASQTEIREAYDRLCQVYSAQIQTNPSMRDFAERKRSEIDAAYNSLMYGSTGFSQNSSAQNAANSGNYSNSGSNGSYDASGSNGRNAYYGGTSGGNPFGYNNAYSSSNQGLCGKTSISDLLCGLCLFETCCDRGCMC